jgi:hypothetical protein
MSAVSKIVADRKLFRGAALVAILAPFALLAACAEPPPPAPAPVYVAPPAPAPAPVPPARG